ncbi:hypothetical protein [Paraburkholderia sp. RL17-337-BIB-A]|uniref:hypothetical protein n=1 Tax=Paraburkholderia sp. RL17-337-BIB-A TaxID=3031636 RepID=UPI0038BABEE6
MGLAAASRFPLADSHALNLKDSVNGKRIGIISGGNIDLERLCSLVAASALTRFPGGGEIDSGQRIYVTQTWSYVEGIEQHANHV